MPTKRSHGESPGRRVQLHRAISKLGWGSRGEGQRWIAEGRVRVDGRVCTDPFIWIDLETSRVTLDQKAPPPPARLLLSIHKPLGIVVTHRDERGRDNVFSLLPKTLPRRASAIILSVIVAAVAGVWGFWFGFRSLASARAVADTPLT